MRRGDARDDPDNAPGHRHQQALGEKLHDDIARRRPDDAPQADLPIRSRTDVSVVFMIPMPPTSSSDSTATLPATTLKVRCARTRSYLHDPHDSLDSASRRRQAGPCSAVTTP